MFEKAKLQSKAIIYSHNKNIYGASHKTVRRQEDFRLRSVLICIVDLKMILFFGFFIYFYKWVVKWEQKLCLFWTGKVGSTALYEWDLITGNGMGNFENGNGISLLQWSLNSFNFSTDTWNQ